MPILDYRCRECGHSFERVVLGGEPIRSVVCPECHDPKARPEAVPRGFFDGIASFSALARDTN
ncbi:MAG: zinc ribbon domain-containing protein [Desulfobacterales bacterium]